MRAVTILLTLGDVALARRSLRQEGCIVGPTPPPTPALPWLRVPEVRAPLNKQPYCCPKTRQCLMAYFNRCSNDPTVCAKQGMICCPLTQQCALPVPDPSGRAFVNCTPPAACKDTEYCSPQLGKCVTPSAKVCDKGHSNQSSCTGDFPVCDDVTERCIKVGADCVSPCFNPAHPPTPAPAPPAPPTPATRAAAADMCAQWGATMGWNCDALDSVCTDWNHVECSGGNITALLLTHKHLTGTIPPSIGLLWSLQKLDLRCNNVTGPIPDTIGNLQNLQHLELRFNRLTGSLPDSICRSTKLTQLSVSDNPHFTGPIPECIGQLTALNTLSFSASNLTGPLPAGVGQLTMLQELDLDGNSMSGLIPGAAIRRLTHLGWLYLEGNNWTCPLPNITSPPWRDLSTTVCH